MTNTLLDASFTWIIIFNIIVYDIVFNLNSLEYNKSFLDVWWIYIPLIYHSINMHHPQRTWPTFFVNTFLKFFLELVIDTKKYYWVRMLITVNILFDNSKHSISSSQDLMDIVKVLILISVNLYNILFFVKSKQKKENYTNRFGLYFS